MSALGVRFVTVHGNKQIVERAIAARGDKNLKILAVTLLTSLSLGEAQDIYGLPAEVTLEQYVVDKALSLVDSGCDGVIASPWEIARIREVVPDKVLIVAPGIRDRGEDTQDQKRTGTAEDSIRDGADYVVVGRSIVNSDDPRAKVEEYVEQIERGLVDR